jgi:hypothetical protein
MEPDSPINSAVDEYTNGMALQDLERPVVLLRRHGSMDMSLLRMLCGWWGL